MNRSTEHEHLFADALADDAPADFRETLLAGTLRQARRRRRWRQIRRTGAAALTAVALLAILARQITPHPPLVVPVMVAETGCEIIHSRPLSESAIVATKPIPPDRLVVSVASVSVVETRMVPGDYREIGDDDLLAMLAPRPVALVSCGPQCRQLIFINPEDEKGFPVN